MRTPWHRQTDGHHCTLIKKDQPSATSLWIKLGVSKCQNWAHSKECQLDWRFYVVDRLIFQLIECFTLSYSSEPLFPPLLRVLAHWTSWIYSMEVFGAIPPLIQCVSDPVGYSYISWSFLSLTKGPYVDFDRVALPSLPIPVMVKSAEYRLFRSHRGERYRR